MSYREFHHRWEYRLKSDPERLWSLLPTPIASIATRAYRRLLKASLGSGCEMRDGDCGFPFWLPVEWEEQPFEWIRPARFGVTRKYIKGPVAELRVLAELKPQTGGGTQLSYQVWARPKSLLGFIVIPLQIGQISARKFATAFHRYDQAVATEVVASGAESGLELSPLVRDRIDTIEARLVAEGVQPDVAARLTDFVQHGDDFSVSRISPYVLADNWGVPRRAVLEACLRATRAGLLDLRWDLLCPLCRGPQESESSLSEVSSKVHCETCRIDFTVNFDRFVEITFRPNASVRTADVKNYCIGSPQRTPHVVAQQLLAARTQRALLLPLEEGRYRLRVLELAGERLLTIDASGSPEAIVSVASDVAGIAGDECSFYPATLHSECQRVGALFILERLSWSNQAATAAEVTALQISETSFPAKPAPRRSNLGGHLDCFSPTRNSTRLYRDMARSAFGRVMNHSRFKTSNRRS